MTTSTQTQLRRGTNTQVLAMTPVAGETVVDTTNNRLCVGDGITAGGIPHVNAKDLQNEAFTFPTVGGTGNAITLTNVPAVGSYVAGLRLTFKAGSNNTSAMTANVDGLGNKNIKKMNSGALADPASGDVVSGGIYDLIYDGTQFQIKALAEGPYSSGALKFLGSATASNSATIDLTSLLSATYDDYLIVLDSVLPATSNARLNMALAQTIAHSTQEPIIAGQLLATLKARSTPTGSNSSGDNEIQFITKRDV